MISRPLRLLAGALLALLVSLPVILLLLAIQRGPSVPDMATLDNAEIARIEELLLEAAPTRATADGLYELELSNEDLNLLLRYGVEVFGLSQDLAADTQLGNDAFSTQLSVRLSEELVPLFLNFRVDFLAGDGQPRLDKVHIGRLQVPERLLRYGLDEFRLAMERRSPAYQELYEFLQQINRVSTTDGVMSLDMDWDPALVSSIRNEAQQLFVSPDDQERIARHYRKIAEITQTLPRVRQARLITFLVPLFEEALIASESGSDPIAENRTLFQALATYMFREDIALLIGTQLAQNLPEARHIDLEIHRREDSASHLISVATITASAGAEIASMLATTKEAYDARYRTGFSFSDLAANETGVLLASMATRDANTAMVIQQRMAMVEKDSDFMPMFGSVQDGISESDFTALYQNRASTEFQNRLEEIRELVRERPVFESLEVD